MALYELNPYGICFMDIRVDYAVPLTIYKRKYTSHYVSVRTVPGVLLTVGTSTARIAGVWGQLYLGTLRCATYYL